jgi:hypothetical protein
MSMAAMEQSGMGINLMGPGMGMMQPGMMSPGMMMRKTYTFRCCSVSVLSFFVLYQTI